MYCYSKGVNADGRVIIEHCYSRQGMLLFRRFNSKVNRRSLGLILN